MSLAVGADLIAVHRLAAVVERYGARFTGRVFTEHELLVCAGRAESLAARWAAKEAVAKALGTGIGQVAFREIEVVSREGSRPQVALHGRAAALAAEQGLTTWAISLSHDSGFALACVVATG